MKKAKKVMLYNILQHAPPKSQEEGLEENVPTGNNVVELTVLQHEIYKLFFVEKMTEKQIALRRGTSQQAINRVILQLKRKGIQDVVCCENTPPVNMKELASPTSSGKTTLKLWRFHALHFVIKPYYFFPRYHRIRLEKGNYGINYREWVIKLHPDMVELQLRGNEDFASEDKWESTRKAEASFNRTLRELMESYGFKVWKEKKANIRLVNQNLAQNPSELSQATENFIQVRGEDGKVWLQVDKSKGWEHEYTHPERALGDSELLEPYLNDMIYNSPPTMSFITSQLSDLSGAVVDFIQESRTFQADTKQSMGRLTDALTGLVASTQMLLQILTPKQPPAHEADVELKGVPSYIG
jgi:predicted DNA-binding protein (UPF0251 family)